MMMLRADSASSSVTSNSSRRESGIPSTGNATRQRLASREYSTRSTADCSSRTVNFTVARADAGGRLDLHDGRGVVDVEAHALELADQGVGGGVRWRVGRADLDVVRA